MSRNKQTGKSKLRWKNSLKKFVTMEPSTDEDIIWFKVNKALTYFPQDLYLCYSYISPKMSCRNLENYDSKLEHIYNDILKYKFMGNVIIIIYI